jgi:hypothetical protein
VAKKPKNGHGQGLDAGTSSLRFLLVVVGLLLRWRKVVVALAVVLASVMPIRWTNIVVVVQVDEQDEAARALGLLIHVKCIHELCPLSY